MDESEELALLDEEIRSLFEDSKYKRFYWRHRAKRLAQNKEWRRLHGQEYWKEYRRRRQEAANQSLPNK